jgi:hypothetical protein
VTATNAPFVTPTQASAAVVALWNAREAANLRRDAAALGQLETGTDLLESQYALDGLVCKCWAWYWNRAPRTIRDLTIYYPRQTHYPLYLLAQVSAALPGASVPPTAATAELIVTRASPSEPWRIATQIADNAYSPSVAGTDLPTPLSDSGGYDSPVSPSAVAAARRWPAMLAAYYTQLKDAGSPPVWSLFLPGADTTGTDLTKRRQGYTSGGMVSHYAFSVGQPDEPWVLMIGPYVASCADVLETNTQALVKPHTVFVQRDGPGQAWGPDLNTGYYSKVITTFEWPVCILQLHSTLIVIGPTDGRAYPIHDGGIPAQFAPGVTEIK